MLTPDTFTRGVEQACKSFNNQLATKKSQAYCDEDLVKKKGQAFKSFADKTILDVETEGTVGDGVVDFDLTEDNWIESQSVSEEPEVLLVNTARLPLTNNRSTPGEYPKHCYQVLY
jgi:hypothetical protein